jgi:SAM-dependent methyltransferase
MTPQHEILKPDTLRAEQEIVQARKFQGRQLREYDGYLFSGQNYRIPRPSAVTDFLRPICVGDTVSLDGIFQGISIADDGRPVQWVDMGGGRALPMRQLGSDPEVRHRLIMTNVDLFDFGVKGLEPKEVDYLEGRNPGVMQEAAAPHLIQANVETVKLPEPADVITSVEMIQYLDNPLVSLSNWYNQLADNGLMLITTETDWASWIRYDSGLGNENETPTKHLLQALSLAGVAHAASDETDWENGTRPILDPGRFRNLVIQKKPGTEMLVHSKVKKIWVNPMDYKAVYYEFPEPDGLPLISIIETDSTS